jgi:hypothetical protein
MKKTLLFLGCIALSVASCNKIETMEEPVQDSPRHLKVNITVNNGVETRAVKTGWATGDKIYVAFDVCFPAELPSFLVLTYNGFSWISEFTDYTLEELLLEKETGTLAAAFVSTDKKLEFQYMVDTVDNPYLPMLSLTDYEDNQGMYLSADNVNYYVEDGTLTAQLNMDLRESTFVHFFLDGVPENADKNFSLCCDKLAPAHFNRFTYVLIDLPESNYHLELGPWSDFKAGKPGDPIRGQYLNGGLEFNCVLSSSFGIETEYIFYIVDNNGTPNDTSDDTTYSLTKTTTLSGKEAIRFPWFSNSDVWEVLTPSNINAEFNGYNNEVNW